MKKHTAPTLELKTKTGKPVFGNGRLQYSLEQSDKYRIEVYSNTHTDSDRSRASNLARAEAQIGEPLEWVKGKDIEYITLSF